jgi:crotonobetainyl-CoA:carnitine CoA-transferase CaiB-like acyl-CoA transferase
VHRSAELESTGGALKPRRPGGLDRMGFSGDRIQEINPRTIC